MLTGLTYRVSSLSIILDEIKSVYESELDDKQKTELSKLSNSCRNVLIELEKELDNHGELAVSQSGLRKKVKRVWQRHDWEPENIRELRNRITSNVTLLNTYLDGVSRYHLFI
jgi:hypothetical protein